MPPDASSRPATGLNFIETSTLLYGPPGATMTLNAFSVARCTSTFLPLGAPAISSTAHCPSTVVQPSIPSASKSNVSVGTLSGTLSSSAAFAARDRGHHAPATSAATVLLSIVRRVTFIVGGATSSVSRRCRGRRRSPSLARADRDHPWWPPPDP